MGSWLESFLNSPEKNMQWIKSRNCDAIDDK